MKVGENMNFLKRYLATLLIILVGLVTFQINRVIASTVEETFIETLYTVTYEEAAEFDKRIEEDYHDFVVKELNQAPNLPLMPVILVSFESQYMTNLINEQFDSLVEADYLEKLLINGDLTRIYVYAYEHQANYSVVDLNMISETLEDDLIKQKWSFTIVEQDTNQNETTTWELEALFNRSATSNLLTHFELTQDSPFK